VAQSGIVLIIQFTLLGMTVVFAFGLWITCKRKFLLLKLYTIVLAAFVGVQIFAVIMLAMGSAETEDIANTVFEQARPLPRTRCSFRRRCALQLPRAPLPPLRWPRNGAARARCGSRRKHGRATGAAHRHPWPPTATHRHPSPPKPTHRHPSPPKPTRARGRPPERVRLACAGRRVNCRPNCPPPLLLSATLSASCTGRAGSRQGGRSAPASIEARSRTVASASTVLSLCT